MASELQQLLARTWIFSDLAPQELEELTGLARLRIARARQHVVKKGESGGQIFAVLRGQLKVLTPGVERDAAFRILGAGELFGEIAAFDGQLRSATVTALTPCHLGVIDHVDFGAFLDRHPSVSRKLLAALARRVRQLSARVEDRAFLDLPARLAKLLVGLCRDHGEVTPEGHVAPVRLSQREIGELVDGTRESVNKLLRSWQREGLVEHTPEAIVVRRPAALRRLAGGS